MRKTDGKKMTKTKGNLNTFKLLWIFAGLFSMLAVFTSCSEYFLKHVSYSEGNNKASIYGHKAWCLDCSLVAGEIEQDGFTFSGANCVYPKSGSCGGSTTESCFMGCACGEEEGNSVYMAILGDTGSKSGMAAGLINGCMCVSCDEEFSSFGYYLPEAYNAGAVAEELEKYGELFGDAQ